MQEPGISTVVILLSVVAGLLLILVATVNGIRGHLGRIERLLAVKAEPSSAPPGPLAVDSTPGGTFETFLNEDPARKLLSKKEQASAYRKWRQQNGMNWSNS